MLLRAIVLLISGTFIVLAGWSKNYSVVHTSMSAKAHLWTTVILLGIWRWAANHMTKQIQNRGFVWEALFGYILWKKSAAHYAPLVLFYV